MNATNEFRSRKLGISLVLIAGILWGVSGSVAQYLFQQRGFSTEWLVVVRVLVSGGILLAFAYKTEGQRVWEIWQDKRDRVSLVSFSIFGMLAVQYTYFTAIQLSNAATATILQYLAPVLITVFVAVRMKRLPHVKELLAIGLAMLGTFLLVTHGSISTLSISPIAMFWGLASAFTLAFYTVYPQKLLRKWGSSIVIGWSMLLGGIGFSFVHPPWVLEGEWSASSFLAVFFIIIFGTLIAFYMYLESLKYLSATETSLLACIEPLFAAVVAVIWLHVDFGIVDWFGTLFILSTVAVLAIGEGKRNKRKQAA